MKETRSCPARDRWYDFLFLLFVNGQLFFTAFY